MARLEIDPGDERPVVTWGQFVRIVAIGTALSAVTAAIASAGFLYANFSDGQARMVADLGRVWSTISDLRGDIGKIQTALGAAEKADLSRDGRIQALHENYLAAAESMTRLSSTMAQTIQLTDGKVDSLLAETNKLEVSVARIETAVKYGGKPDAVPGHP